MPPLRVYPVPQELPSDMSNVDAIEEWQRQLERFIAEGQT